MARELNFNKISVIKVLFALLLIAVTPAFSQNLITHGDFEYASGVTQFDFETDYEYYGAPPYLTDPGVYHVKRNPHDYHPQMFYDMGDHTSGLGKFFMANGKGLLSNDRVWSKTVTVQPNSYYNFTFWATHISNVGNSLYLAKFRVKINGTQIGSDFVPQYVSGGYWDQFPAQTWYSGSNTSHHYYI